MNRDPIPTFRRAGRAVVRLATSRRFWTRTAGVVLVTAAIVAFGYAGALVSTSRCSTRTRQSLSEFRPADLKMEWSDASELVAVPFTTSFTLADEKANSVFAPKIMYRLSEPRAPESESEQQKRMAGPEDARGLVRCCVPLPFVVRAHYQASYSFPRQGFLRDGRWSRSGGRVEGVMTYIAAFGLTVRINDWNISYMFD